MGGTPNGHLIYGVGFSNKKYPITIDGKKTKEYETWRGILKRCHEQAYQEREPTYVGCSVCEEWHCYDTFYEWVISQDNYEKWKEGGRKWCIDKDISVKGNKIYSPNTCFLVPKNVNNLFTNRCLHRGELPIGVSYSEKLNKFLVYCMNPFQEKSEKSLRKHATYVGTYNTVFDAFNAYKAYKKNIIDRVAKAEFDNGNITKECYLAMLKYEININD